MTLPKAAEAYSRVELVLDSGHNLPTLAKHLGALDKHNVEVGELRRLFASAKDERRRASLQHEIDVLTSPQAKPRPLADESDHRRGPKGARPWSARPTSARMQALEVMKTIPEEKQHTRPLSSKMRGATSDPALGPDRCSRGETSSSACSVGSTDSIEDELDRHEIKQLWSTSFDARHPACNVFDSCTATFWMSSGLYPQLLGFRFRRTILLWKVVVYCTGVQTLRLHWRLPTDRWSQIKQSDATEHIDATLTEFVFNLGAASNNREATAVKLEVVDGAHFAIVRHLTFVEQAGSERVDNIEFRL